MAISDLISAGSGAFTRGLQIAEERKRTELSRQTLGMNQEAQAFNQKMEINQKNLEAYTSAAKQSKDAATALKLQHDKQRQIIDLEEDPATKTAMIAGWAARGDMMVKSVKEIYAPLMQAAGSLAQNNVIAGNTPALLEQEMNNTLGATTLRDQAKLDVLKTKQEEEVKAEAKNEATISSTKKLQTERSRLESQLPSLRGQDRSDTQREIDEITRQINKAELDRENKLREANILTDRRADMSTKDLRINAITKIKTTPIDIKGNINSDLNQRYDESDWIDAEKTESGGYTSNQMKALTVSIADSVDTAQALLTVEQKNAVSPNVLIDMAYEYFIREGAVEPFEYGSFKRNKLRINSQRMREASAEFSRKVREADYGDDPIFAPLKVERNPADQPNQPRNPKKVGDTFSQTVDGVKRNYKATQVDSLGNVLDADEI